MEAGTIIAIVSTSTANAIAFGLTLVKLGRLSERFDLVWAWYTKEFGPDAPRNRRQDDPDHDTFTEDRRRELELARLHLENRFRKQ